MLRVTLREIAKECGVTTATVSLALRDSPQISTDRKAEIKDVAARLGYRPDPALSLIARARWKPSHNYVGHRLALVNGEPVNNPYAVTLRDTITSNAESLGYHIEEFSLSGKTQIKKLVRQLYHRGVRGTILTNVSNPAAAEAFDGWMPVVVTGHLEDAPITHHIMPDHFNSARIALRYVRNKSLKRILLALTPQSFRWHDAYSRASILRGAFDVFHEYDQSTYTQTIEVFEYSRHKTKQEQQVDLRALVKKFKPDVIIASNIATYFHVGPPHFSLPEDFHFICLDLPKDHIGKVAGNYSQPEEVGRVCVDMIELQIQRSSFNLPKCRNTVLVESRWCDGPTFPRGDAQAH